MQLCNEDRAIRAASGGDGVGESVTSRPAGRALLSCVAGPRRSHGTPPRRPRPLALRGLIVGAVVAALAACEGAPDVVVGHTVATSAPARGDTLVSGAAGPQGPLVVTAAVRKDAFPARIEALGSARANEAVDITSRTSNVIVRIRFEEGQNVERGQVLVELDAAQMRADLAAAEAALVESRASFERSRLLAGNAALSRAQADQIEAAWKSNEAKAAAATARLNDQFIRAPFKGRTGLRRVSVGGLVNPGTVITTVDDVSVIKLDFAVPETSVAVLRPGLRIAARSAAYPGREFHGRIASVDPRVDPVSRSMAVRAELPNQDGVLMPGMLMLVILTRDVAPALVVPEKAVVPEQGRTFVFVVNRGRASRREVQLGRHRPGEVEVVAGLRENERVVVDGGLRVRDGAQVREVDVVRQVPDEGRRPVRAS
jgi:membrane fusion protein (multidrug efflux system)